MTVAALLPAGTSAWALLPLALAVVREGLLTLPALLAKLTTAPAAIFAARSSCSTSRP